MTPAPTLVLWAAFLALILLLLAVDLGLLNRKDHEVSAGEALGLSAVWAALALLFSGFVAWRFGSAKGLDFLTGYLIELSLSVDNLFVFALVFASLGIPGHLQHRVLFWGILGALVLRAGMIVGGAAIGSWRSPGGARAVGQRGRGDRPAALRDPASPASRRPRGRPGRRLPRPWPRPSRPAWRRRRAHR